MKFEIGRHGIRVIPEDDEDRAYVEDTLGLKTGDDFIRLRRRNVSASSQLYCLEAVSDKYMATIEEWMKDPA